ncbi:MAG TPA: ABC transporter ATP-binding protein [Dehalococcoidia bacterium]|nr:ABC transporter ATP-binding protein [Dehalococcoidia bacterium]
MRSAPAISVRGLRKSYGSIEAVRGIDFEVREGEVFALLGPNGAGKTTTVEILEGHRKRSAGEVSVLGFDPEKGGRSFRERIGIVLQETGVERYLTVAESIEMFRGYYPAPLPLDEVLEVVGLRDQRNVRVRKLSGGQQRRLDVAIGLAGNPDLLFLDEPTTGFDPAARRNAWQMIRNLRSLGKTVLLTTHYLDEADNLADRVAIISAGVIVAEGTPAQLIASEPSSTIRFRAATSQPLPPELASVAALDNGVTTIRTATPTRVLYELLRWANDNGIELEELTLSRASLEDVYLKLVGATEPEAVS